MNWIAQSGDKRAGEQMRLASLRSMFDEHSHRLYYDLLARAIKADGVRNVALTGAYGTGKSSVLAELLKERGDEVVELSLSTIAPLPRDAVGEPKGSTSGGDASRTNLIQKEIVKQLLYRLPSDKTPRSRFRRTSAPNRKREWRVALAVGLAVISLALVLGLLQPSVELVVPEPWWRRWIAYVLLAGIAVGAAWLTGRLVGSRPTMSASVGTGLTSVTLSNDSGTYFDEYLDEIVYFFQASKAKIVVIEDIDRFEDVQVFDTLRALNGLLNSSRALTPIVFVYAIRDSVFEQIGSAGDPSGDTDQAKKAVELASRTKFFDVVIPVVPFVTADNARDLMSGVMNTTGVTIDPALIRLAARHTADMRLIHNIRNEFEVYRDRLVLPEDHVYGINDDLVFAMVVYKNTHLADFERIRHKESTLDTLYVKWRELVRENLKVETNRLVNLRTALDLEETADARARYLGELLVMHRDILQAGLRAAHGVQASVSLSGAADELAITQRSAWGKIASGTPLQFQFHAGRYNNLVAQMTFTAEQLGALVGIDIDPAEWGEADLSEVEEQIAACEERIWFLRHHTWEELCDHPELTLPAKDAPNAESTQSAPPGRAGRIKAATPTETETAPQPEPAVPVTFDQLVEQILTSPLSRAMVRRGFITSHFALYTSTYYGTHLGPEALEYVRRCIEPGTPEVDLVLDERSVEQLLTEQGAEKNDRAEIFEDPSIFNVSIMNYLLKERPGAAATVTKRLARWGEQESEFVDAYTARGEQPELLLAAMAPDWKDVVRYAAASPDVPAKKRTAVLNAVLLTIPESNGYTVDDQVRQRLEKVYRDLGSVTTPASPERAEIALGIVAACDGILESVAPLNKHAREVAVARRLYPVTEENLRELSAVSSIALDVLRSHDRRVHEHAIEHLSAYLAAFESSPTTDHTIEDPGAFAQIVTDAAERGDVTSLGMLIESAAAGCRVGALTEVPAVAWPFVVAGDRTDPSFKNVHAYISERGRVDDPIATFLTGHSEIVWEEETPVAQRKSVAVSILDAHTTLPDVDTRVALAAALEPGMIPADEIVPRSGNLPARLIEKGLLADDDSTFTSGLMVDWATREAAIKASKNFVTISGPTTLPVAHVAQLLRSEAVPSPVKEAVVRDLVSYLADASASHAEDIARSLNARGWLIESEQIKALIDSGVSDREIVRLIARDRGMSTDTLRCLLRAMGEDYARIADPGPRPAYLPDDADHRAVLERLQGAPVSSYDTDTKRQGMLRVNLHKADR